MSRSGRFGMKSYLYGGIAVLVLYCQGHTADLHFQAVDSVQFPSSYPIMQWQFADVDGDGYDEVIALTRNKYFVYSFSRDTMILRDSTTSRFLGELLTDYDSDGQMDLVTLDQQRQLNLQSGFQSANRRIVDTITSGYLWNPSPEHGVNLMLVDADHTGDSELLLTGTEEFLVSADFIRDLEFYDGGSVSLWAFPAGMEKWVHHGRFTPSGEFAVFLDLAGDANPRICTWGHDYQVTSYHDNMVGWVHVSKYSYQFCAYDVAGNTIKANWGAIGVAALGGDFIASRLGEEIIVFKDGPSFDSNLFVPTNNWGAYCLGIEGDSLSVLWAKDVQAVTQADVFLLLSIPQTYCAWKNPLHCSLYAGADGSELYAITGLRSGFETKEAKVRGGSDSLIQVVQVSGTKVILMQQMEPTDVPDNSVLVPKSFVLRQNYPNPFNGGTTIRYSLNRSARVKLEVLNMLGQVVATLVDGVQSKGEKSVFWTGTDSNGHAVASGTYFSRLTIDAESGVIKMTMLK